MKLLIIVSEQMTDEDKNEITMLLSQRTNSMSENLLMFHGLSLKLLGLLV
jgi:hypothetical protein